MNTVTFNEMQGSPSSMILGWWKKLWGDAGDVTMGPTMKDLILLKEFGFNHQRNEGLFEEIMFPMIISDM